jgi:hypothetical protein
MKRSSAQSSVVPLDVALDADSHGPIVEHGRGRHKSPAINADFPLVNLGVALGKGHGAQPDECLESSKNAIPVLSFHE